VFIKGKSSTTQDRWLLVRCPGSNINLHFAIASEFIVLVVLLIGLVVAIANAGQLNISQSSTSCCITKQILQSLFVFLVLSRMDYGYSALMAGFTANLLWKLQSVMNAAAPLVCSARRSGVTLLRRRHQTSCWRGHQTATCDQPPLHIYSCRRQTTRPSASELSLWSLRWNSLPPYVTLSLSLPVFRSLKTELFARWSGTVWQFLYRLTLSLRHIMFFLLSDHDVACHRSR